MRDRHATFHYGVRKYLDIENAGGEPRHAFDVMRGGNKFLDNADRNVFVSEEAHHAAAIGYTFSELTTSCA